jgi:hypothetical protein
MSELVWEDQSCPSPWLDSYLPEACLAPATAFVEIKDEGQKAPDLWTRLKGEIEVRGKPFSGFVPVVAQPAVQVNRPVGRHGPAYRRVGYKGRKVKVLQRGYLGGDTSPEESGCLRVVYGGAAPNLGHGPLAVPLLVDTDQVSTLKLLLALVR